MNPIPALEAARRGRLYPAVILHGGNDELRRHEAMTLARTLLCDEEDPDDRPCGVCRHCRRIVAAPAAKGEEAPFHPDLRVLERDLKASTSVDATREFLKTAQLSPFEARGQVFVVASAESLTGEGANALLKMLEEPHTSAPRHFLLLAPSRFDLLPTLRSRSLSIFLGAADAVAADEVEPLARTFAAAVGQYARTGSAVYLLVAAEALAKGGGWDDPRAGRPWARSAAAVVRALDLSEEVPAAARRALLALAEELLGAPALRLRAISPERILEGLVAKHLVAAS
ncbi:MAG TPA: hypothetical protein VEG34_10585 [Thermoanaerobaculia bacterium]|nr:hypothetical protein [Thermoanaerobaculia bacterium]